MLLLKTNKAMQIDPMYYGVFFDVDKPEMAAIATRIEQIKYLNISDNLIQKEVKLLMPDGEFKWYMVLSARSFKIENSVDNTYFAVCNCVEIK